MTAKEVSFKKSDVIVSKTDLKGRITYVNDVFCQVSGYKETELLGQPHSLIRHKGMPRCVFKLLWDKISNGEEVFAYVVNECKNGDYYWVLAHVTPTLNARGEIVGYHSNRRKPSREVVRNTIEPIYKKLLEVEAAAGRKSAPSEGFNHLVEILTSQEISYDEFVLSLAKEHVHE